MLANLGDKWNVESYSLHIQRTDLPWPRRSHRVTQGWTDFRCRDPLMLAWAGILGRAGHPPAFASRLLPFWPHQALTRALSRADIVMVHPPYPWEWVRRHTPFEVPMVLHEHSIEADMYQPRGSWWSRRISAEVARCENLALREADLVLVTSDDDDAKVREAGALRTAVVANGVDLERFRPVPLVERRRLRAALSLPAHKRLAVFVGSGHPPNIEAVSLLEKSAPEFARVGVGLVVVGRCGLGRPPVDNVLHVGEVTDVASYLQAADVAVCPLVSGSGTSIKTIEFLASGTPLVSTAAGVRGLGVQAGVHAEVCDLELIPARVGELLDAPDRQARLGGAGRRLAQEQHSWSAAGAAAAAALEKLMLESNRASRLEPQCSGA